MDKKWLAFRVVHSLGGIRLVNEYGPPVKIIPNAINGKAASFKIASYGALFNSTEKIGLPIIGVEFFTHSGQFKGTDIPEWLSYYKFGESVWANEEGIRLWSNIGTGAHKAKNGHLWDLGSRVSQQLRVCARRLNELSNSYNSQLLSVSEEKDFTKNNRFMNGYTWLCYLSIQSFLVDICILRDYLAEFAASYVFELPSEKKHLKITTISGLKKHCINDTNSNDPLAQELKDITSEDGWLKELGEYRDLVVHSAPLARAERKLFAIRKTREISGGEIPCISCPIPLNPQEISASRANGSMFKDFEEQFNRYVGAGKNDNEFIDGLEYCHNALGRMSLLANSLAKRSPVKPQMMVFDKTNIIGDVQVIRG